MTPKPPASPSSARVLVVEDNEINQILIRKQFELLGYRAEIASDGREALRRFTEEEFSLVLTDIQMPEMDGYAVAQAMRALERAEGRAATPIVALTANAFPEDLERCARAGMNECVTKPATTDKVKAILEKWLPSA